MTSSFDEDLTRALSGAEDAPQQEEKMNGSQKTAHPRGTSRRVALAGALGVGTGVAATLASQYAASAMNDEG
ncbi:hypothetical protein, partial [Rothia nasimurium]